MTSSSSLGNFGLRAGASKKALTLHLVRKSELPEFMARASAFERRFLETTGFTAGLRQLALLPGRDGALAKAVIGVDEPQTATSSNNATGLWSLAGLPQALPSGSLWQLADGDKMDTSKQDALALGWALGSYRFTRYQSEKPRPLAQLQLSNAVDAKRVEALAEATYLVRDLINTPANDLGPDELAAVGVEIAKKYGAKTRIIRGEKLLQENYPAIYAVGKGSVRPPLLFELRWGRKGAPKLSLVGKGVVFDTGGLDIKTNPYMLLMKKDMGGAAHALALAQLIMRSGLDVELRVLCPMVENSVSATAMRPLDVVPTRAGKTIEIGNTDAEGRVILADCLYEAAQDKPDWLIDFATLTGAAAGALGPNIATMLSNNDELAESLMAEGRKVDDPVWRLPLWQPYWGSMRAKTADMSNNSSMAFAGAITAGLFLQQFVPSSQAWAHFDVRSWNDSTSPGKPEGGEAMALRASFAAIEQRFKREQPLAASRPAAAKARGQKR